MSKISLESLNAYTMRWHISRWIREFEEKFLRFFIIFGVKSSLVYARCLSTLSLSQGWLMASRADSLLASPFTNSFSRKSRLYSLIFSSIKRSLLYSPFFIAEKISSSLDPSKGYSPVTIVYRMTPIDHMSHLEVYDCSMTSGDM